MFREEHTHKGMTEVWYQFAQVDGTPLNEFASSLTIPSPATVDKLRKDLMASNRNAFEWVDSRFLNQSRL